MNIGEKLVSMTVGAALVLGIPWLAITRSEILAEADRSAMSAKADERAQQRHALDQAQGFARIDGGTSGVAAYRDNKTGCEWIKAEGGNLRERTAPDAEGVSRQICGEKK